MYEAFMRRKAIEEIDHTRLALVTALHANGMIENIAGQIEEIDSSVNDAKEMIYGGFKKTKDDVDFESNPFYTKALEKHREIDNPTVDSIQSKEPHLDDYYSSDTDQD